MNDVSMTRTCLSVLYVVLYIMWRSLVFSLIWQSHCSKQWWLKTLLNVCGVSLREIIVKIACPVYHRSLLCLAVVRRQQQWRSGAHEAVYEYTVSIAVNEYTV